ncbi:metallophosphoesterase family protein [Bacillus massiliglaciei]|uniref:metallophosphoesterase family protein n=1 Tax=Bacillus massiliglaciei TaxID=1816693 RepID=UPI000ABA518E|nr:DNA repair exonuclease [Bacillus massiliglaciei]
MGGVTFIHAADLHLDSPFTGLKDLPTFVMEDLRASTFRAFQKVIESALFHKVDFVILAGDLFDGENRSLRTQVKMRIEMQRLDAAGIPVYIIHGNHDHLSGSWISIEMPENVHVFGGRTESAVYVKEDGTTVRLYGFSYTKRHVTERMIKTYSKEGEADYHIGLLHGNLEGEAEHSPYAPFSLRDLSDREFDYWALGHIHKRQIVSEEPLAIYPGNIQGRNRKESGPKGCCLVELDGSNKRFQFIDTAEIVWEKEVIQLPETAGFDTTLQLCERIIEEKGGKKTLLDLELDIAGHQDPFFFSLEMLEDIKEILQEQIQEENYAAVHRLRTANHENLNKLTEESPFLQELSALAADFQGVDSAIAPLYKHTAARKYLEPLSKEEGKELLIQAENWLKMQFLKSK